MKLEVGMYVRGNYFAYRGKIGKIIKNYNNDLEIAYKNGILKTTVGSFLDDNKDINGRQYVASFNIIDLIKEGDYVNGQEVYYDEELDFLYVQSFDSDGNFYQTSITKQSFIDNIKSIVTKEQFEQMSYKVGE